MPFVVLIFGLVALLSVPAAAQGLWSVEKANEVDALIEDFLQRRSGGVDIPAMSIAVGIDGRPLVAKGFGNAKPGIPADENTVFHIGSLTKQFTAAAMLRLIERGAVAPLTGAPLTLETPMRDIFHGVGRWMHASDTPVTIYRLLTMTSNLPNFTRRPPPGSDPWGAIETPSLLAALKMYPQRGWPNTFEYSNTDYFLVARIVEAALAASSDKPISYHEYIRDVLIDPLGLARTSFVGEERDGEVLADAHYRRRPAFALPHWLDGSGDMASSAADLFSWNSALMRGAVLDADGLRAMFSEGGRVDPERYYGMGWFVGRDEGWDSYSHSGSVPGYTSYNVVLRRPDTGRWLSVSLLTNSDGVEDLDRLADRIIFVLRRI